MNRSLALILVASSLLCGCGNNDPAPVPPEAPPDPAAPPAASSPPAQPATPVHERVEGAVHVFMTSQLKEFIREKGRLPEDFNEFASARMDSVPFPPPGMQFVIDKTTAEVKAVKIQ